MLTSAHDCFLRSFEAILGDPKKPKERANSPKAGEKLKIWFVSRNKNRCKYFMYLFSKYSVPGKLVSKDIMVTATTHSLCLHGAQSQELGGNCDKVLRQGHYEGGGSIICSDPGRLAGPQLS